MKNSKTIEVLSVFTTDEHKQFALFLEANYFHKHSNKNQKVVLLYEVIRQYLKKPESKLISKEYAYSIVFPKEAYISGRIEKIMTALFKKLEEFIYVNSELKEVDNFKKGIALSVFYQSKELERLNLITISNLEKLRVKKLKKEKTDLYQNYRLQEKISNLRSLYNDRKADLNIPETIRALDAFYLAARLELSCNLMAQGKFHSIFNLESVPEDMPKLLTLFQGKEYINIPLIETYSIVFHLLHSNERDIETNMQNIEELEALLKKYKAVIPDSQARSIYSFVRSFLVRVTNLGRKDLLPKVFKIYQDHLKEGFILYEDGSIHAANFKNIVSAGLKNNSYDWVKTFLNTYQSKIAGTQFPKEVYKYNLANFHFHIDEIEKADEMLSYEFEDLFYSIAAKRLEIKICYVQSMDLLEYKTNAFKIFIHRLSKNKLPEIAKLGNTNFINLLKQIVSPANINKDKKLRIKSKIERTEPLMEKDWLLSII